MGKKTKQKRKYRDSNYSSIGDHRRVGKLLIPPLNDIPNYNSSSWRDDHAPEMLWAFLLAATFPRDEYLSCFRKIVEWMRATFPQTDQPADATPENDTQSGATLNDACEIDHTSLAKLSDQHFKQFVNITLAHPLGYGALRPLLFLDSLPGFIVGAQSWELNRHVWLTRRCHPPFPILPATHNAARLHPRNSLRSFI